MFVGAISQSNLDGFGYADTYSDYYTIPEEVSVAVDGLLEYVGCSNSTTPEEQLECLRTISAPELVDAPTAPR